MQVIGITGDIASGKSEVAGLLRLQGLTVIAADIIGHQLLLERGSVYQAVVSAFGSACLNEAADIDRARLAKIVFADEGKRQLLNEITHPAISAQVARILAELAADGQQLVFVEASLLIDSQIYNQIDQLWLIEADRYLREQRLIYKGYTASEAAARITAQDTDALSFRARAMASAIIINDNDLGHLATAVAAALAKVMADD